MTEDRGTSEGNRLPPGDSERIPPELQRNWDLSNAESRWGLTLRRPSVQRKHAEHARHMPSRTLVGLADEMINNQRMAKSARLYATMRAVKQPATPTEVDAKNILSSMEMDDELMHDDPISEQLRIDKLRDMPHCLTVKRSIKAQLTTSVNENKKKRKPIGSFKRLKYRISMSFVQMSTAMREISSTMELWYHPIKEIEGHFGSGVATYFKFLRWLFAFNFVSCILSAGFIVLPQSLLRMHGNEPFSGWDLLTGSGFFTNSIMYYGFYSNGTVSDGSDVAYSIPMAYLITLLCCYVFTFLLLSIKVARSYRKTFIETTGGLTNVYASKIFCGWDFGIASYKAAHLRSATIYGEFKELLAESQKSGPKGCAIAIYTLIIQASMGILVVVIMSGTGVLLWTLLNQYKVDHMSTTLTMVVPVTITMIMNVYPAFFSWLIQFEGYAGKRTALFVTVIRTYIMECVVIGILLAYWLISNLVSCWQTAFTQEIYRLIIIDFVISIIGIFIAQMLRWKLYITGWKKIGAPRFDIARNTLNLTYNQTLFWIAFYFSPPMSIIIVVKLILTFYIKKYGILNHCEPPSRSWRAAQTQTLFLALAFLSMVGVLSAHGYMMRIIPTQECGPFQGYDYTWDMVIQGVLQLQSDSQFWMIVTALAKPGVGAAVIIAMCVGVYYLRAKAGARKEMVQILRQMLVMEAHDKEFLLSGISRVADEQWLHNLNSVPTQRPSQQHNPTKRYAPVESSPRHNRYSELNSATERPSGSTANNPEPSNSLHLSLFPGNTRENSDQKHGPYMELDKRRSVSSDDSSIHNSIKSEDANEGITQQYNFLY